MKPILLLINNYSKKMKTLCFSPHTPPEIRPQAILIGKMVPEWKRQGIEPVILSLPGEEWNIDVPKYKMPRFKPNKFLAKIPGYFRLAEFFYHRQLVKLCLKIMAKEKIEAIFSFANPQVCNIVGAMVRKQTGIPFIAHFSDPWYDSEYQNLSKRQAKRILKKETAIMEQADRIIFVSQETLDLVMKKYPTEIRQKARVIPHCYDLNDYPKDEPKKENKFVISYIGVFYEQRNPGILFQTLSKITEEDETFLEKIKIVLVGSVDNYAGYTYEKIEKMLRQYGLEKITEILPRVEFKESLRLMKQSDCLVVIDANFGISPFLPSKAIDYAASGKIILGITPTNSTISKFLDKLGYRSFNYEETEEMAAYLKDLAAGKIKHHLNWEFLKNYDVKNTTAKLVAIIKEII